MDHYMVAGADFFMLQKKETDGALDTLRFTTRHKAVAFDDSHRYPKAHGCPSRFPRETSLRLILLA
jgi:hypothetical protein